MENQIKFFFHKIDVFCRKKMLSCTLNSVLFLQSAEDAIDNFFDNVYGFNKFKMPIIRVLNGIKNKINKNPYFSTINDKQLKAGVEALKLNRLPVCVAPYVAMNFDVSGHVTACCYSRDYVLGDFSKSSLNDIWFNNPRREKLLNDVNTYNLNTQACNLCERYIKYQNDAILIKMYEKQSKPNLNKYPIRMDFEFSNVCNYECIMCGGKWSSSIRKNREKMPPLKLPVKDNFIEELRDFIPHLKFANFLGGEPFLSEHYFKIWEMMAELNKDIEISIVTNGSVYNDKVQNILDSFNNIIICVSLDSLKEDVYASIRKNGNLQNVLNNISKFKAQGKLCWINTCAMIQNIYEVPELTDFCHNCDIGITFLPVEDALGGMVKGIHENGVDEGVSNGVCREQMESSCEELIPEFRLKTLPLSELENILKMIEKLEEDKKDVYKQDLKNGISALKHQILGYIKDKQ